MRATGEALAEGGSGKGPPGRAHVALQQDLQVSGVEISPVM